MKELTMLDYQYIKFEKLDILKAIISKEKDPLIRVTKAYNYGVIQGKRQERIKHKKTK